MHVTVDAFIESWSDDRAMLISPYPAAVGDEFTMRISTSSGELASFAATVVACEPIFDHAATRFRLHVFTDAPAAADDDDEPRYGQPDSF